MPLLDLPAMVSIKRHIVVLLAVLAAGACTAVSAPIQEMTDARMAIAAAADADAQDYAPDQLVEARLLLKSAESNLERRAYNAARRDARSAKAMATQARKQAEAKAASGGDPSPQPPA